MPKGKREKEKKTNLDAPRGHIEVRGQLLAELSIGLGVLLEDGLENLELLAGCAFSVLDLIGGVRVEGPKVNCRGIVCIGD